MKIEEMKDSKMCTLIAAQPYIRAVQIADALDLGIDEVEDELLPHVNRGHLVTKDVLAPNGRSVPGYAFSNEFRKSEAYAAIVAASQPKVIALSMSEGSAAALATLAAAAPTVDKVIGRAPVAAEPESDAEKSSRQPSRAAIVIDFIQANGPASQAQIRGLLKLKPTEHVSSALSSAVQRGRLVRDGDNWVVGPNLNEMRSAPAAKSAAKPPTSLPQGFRCGCWSDGDVELQRGGQQLAVLTMDECRIIARMVEGAAA